MFERGLGLRDGSGGGGGGGSGMMLRLWITGYFCCCGYPLFSEDLSEAKGQRYVVLPND